MMLALAGILAPASSFALGFLGNTTMTQSGQTVPRRGAFLEPWQSVNLTTETWPIEPNQQVVAVVTTNNWQTTQEYEFSFAGNFGNNTRWSLNLGPWPKGTQPQWYLRATRFGQANAYFDNNGGSNFAIYQRWAPPYKEGAILQWFATDYKIIMKRLPEVVEAGYGAIYLPGPSKGGVGGFSAGYDPADRFDLGDRFQKGTVRTNFGTTQELLDLIRVAKRYGIEVYCDIVLNHNANRAAQGINQYPDMIPEDFHIRSSADTGNSEINFGTASAFSFGMLHHDLLGLTDIAHEDGNNVSGTLTLPSYATFNTWGKPSFVRQPTTPQLYPNNTPVAEDVREYLERWMKWLVGTIGFDGFRLDAVKHMPPGYLGWAPDQAAAGGFSKGNLLPTLLSQYPNLTIFAEDYTSGSYELREYAKTGTHLLDFPLFFGMKNVFNSNGLGNLDATLGNGYGTDPATGLAYQFGGISPDTAVDFVHSHDDGPPTSSNMAHAFILGKPGRSKIYYDGNNIEPGNYTFFPKPGRYDALGNGSDLLTRLVNANSRFGRGYAVKRWGTNNLLVLERQVNGGGLMLLGLNSRGDNTAQTVTVQTGFNAGTILEDQSGQQPDVTVGANKQVTITVPSNFSATESNNGRGYVMYTPKVPTTLGDNPIEITQIDSARPVVASKTTVNTPNGSYASARTFEAFTVEQDRISLNIKTTNNATSAFIRLNQGLPINGASPVSGSAEAIVDGFVQLAAPKPGEFSLKTLDLSGLPDGLHLLKIRIFGDSGGGPGIYRDVNTWVYLKRGLRTGWKLDGDLTDFGNPLYSQFRNASSNNNRIDGIYAQNDDRYLYIGLAGRVDASNNFTNGVGLFLDTNGPGAGLNNVETLADDSGPAARLLSNQKFALPGTMAADFAVGSFRYAGLSSSPEASFVGGPIQTPVVGAEAGLFGINPSTLQILQPKQVAMASQFRNAKTDPAKGLEIAIPLREIFSSSVPNTILGLAYLSTTGEAGTFLNATNPLRATLGGRPAPNAFLTNQFIPSQPNVEFNPGSNSASLTGAQSIPIRKAALQNNAQIAVSAGPVVTEWRTQFVQRVVIRNTSATTINGPFALRTVLPSGVTMDNKSELSLVVPGASYIINNATRLAPGQTLTFDVRYRASNVSAVTPSYEVLAGRGVL